MVKFGKNRNVNKSNCKIQKKRPELRLVAVSFLYLGTGGREEQSELPVYHQ